MEDTYLEVTFYFLKLQKCLILFFLFNIMKMQILQKGKYQRQKLRMTQTLAEEPTVQPWPLGSVFMEKIVRFMKAIFFLKLT